MFNRMRNTPKPTQQASVIGRDVESEFGTRVRALRESLQRSQDAVASRMREAGHDWHQTTISKVEAGQRGVSLNEAYALALILGAHLRDFLSKGPGELQREMDRAQARYFEVNEILGAITQRHQAAEQEWLGVMDKLDEAVKPSTKRRGKR
jgi:transcriptional regulator with XRE-family HTH domain